MLLMQEAAAAHRVHPPEASGNAAASDDDDNTVLPASASSAKHLSFFWALITLQLTVPACHLELPLGHKLADCCNSEQEAGRITYTSYLQVRALVSRRGAGRCIDSKPQQVANTAPSDAQNRNSFAKKPPRAGTKRKTSNLGDR